ncbi:hypothetical protein KSS87_017238 [Heliosperma pusillum]|nr:hypothetical protein KSS87_017238 [Heliosperma pusillum]
MTTKQKYIASITPDTQKWTAKVRVLEKSFPRTASQSSNKYQRLILTDGQGMRVQATIFGEDIESLSNTLHTLGHYYVSNAIVRLIPEQHRIVNNKYQWTLSTKNPIREVSEEELDGRVIAANFNLVSFSHLPQYVESGTLIDTLAVVADIYPKRTTKDETTLQEFLLINHEMKPTILTMWDELASNEGSYISQFLESFPIILATRLRVTSYNEQIKLLKKDKAVPAPTMNARAPPAVIPITSVSETTKHMLETNLCRAQRNILLSKMWSGPRCSTKVHSYSNLYTIVRYAAFHYHDLYCRSILHTDRCNFQIELADGATSLTTTIFGENAELVFKINAKILMELSEDPHQILPPDSGSIFCLWTLGRGSASGLWVQVLPLTLFLTRLQALLPYSGSRLDFMFYFRILAPGYISGSGSKFNLKFFFWILPPGSASTSSIHVILPLTFLARHVAHTNSVKFGHDNCP